MPQFHPINSSNWVRDLKKIIRLCRAVRERELCWKSGDVCARTSLYTHRILAWLPGTVVLTSACRFFGGRETHKIIREKPLWKEKRSTYNDDWKNLSNELSFVLVPPQIRRVLLFVARRIRFETHITNNFTQTLIYNHIYHSTHYKAHPAMFFLSIFHSLISKYHTLLLNM